MPPIKDFLLELKDQVKQDNVPVSAAGIAFFGFFALFPSLTALVSIYGLVADPADVVTQLEDGLSAAPEALRGFIIDQAKSSAEDAGGGTLVAAILGIVIALWSASAAVKHLIAALNRIYGFRETRGFVQLRGASYLFTLGAILTMAIALFLLAVLPALLAALDLGSAGQLIIGILRFPGMILFMAGALSILYFLGPDRPDGYRFRWVTKGSIFATILWALLSGLLSIYFSSLDADDAGIQALIGVLTALMIFLQITSLCVLLGAEIDATLEVFERRSRAASEEKVAAAMTDGGKRTLVGALLGTAVGIALGQRPRQKE